MKLPRFVQLMQHRGGKSAGAIRVSFGIASNSPTCERFLEFVAGLRDQTRLTLGEVTFDIESLPRHSRRLLSGSSWRPVRWTPPHGVRAAPPRGLSQRASANGTLPSHGSPTPRSRPVSNQPGILFGLTKVLADYSANITYVDIIAHQDRDAEIYLEFSIESDIAPVTADLEQVAGVTTVEITPSFSKIYGKRIVIMGGGAQVGQVALGAISEADRHNIRGERISVDTIPLVGEEALASAVRAVVRLPRVRLLVLAGSIMGGDICAAVEEVRAEGAVRHLAEHGRQRSRRRRPRGVRSGASRRDGRDGDRRHREVRHRAPAEATLLKVRVAAGASAAFQPSSLSSAGGFRCSPRFIARSRSARSISRVSSSVIVQ